MATEPRIPNENEAIGRRFVDAAWNDGDFDLVANLCTPDVVVNDPATPTVATGPDIFEQYVSRRRKAYADLELTVENITVADETVVVRTAGHGTRTGHFLGRDTTGDDSTVTGIEVIHIKDAAVAEWSGALLDEAEVATFAEGLRGEVVRPGDDGYDEARAIWNGMIDRYPALIARCTGVADVIDAVEFARANDLLVAVRGGGHNVAGTAICNGGLVIDLSEMNGIHVDLNSETVRAEGGATWGDVDRETQAFGLATPGGVVSITGIAGLTLGGGMGWLRRKYGLCIDNLVSVDLVTATGEFVTASANQNAELFWGIKGGGGNFGVVTSFEYRLHPVGPEVMFAAVMYPLDIARDIVAKWRDYVEDIPEEVSTEAIFWSVPAVPDFPEEIHDEPVVVLAAMHSGSVAEGERVLQPLREFAEPLLDMRGPMPYTAVQSMFDPFFPKGELRYYWKSLDLDRLDDEVIDVIVDVAADRPSPKTIIPIWHHGGAMGRVDASETAYGDRGTQYMVSIDSTWESPADTDANVEWTREMWADLHRFSDGSLYLNFPGMGEEGETLVRAAYRDETYDRLVALKNQYDPENLFQMNQNITPTV